MRAIDRREGEEGGTRGALLREEKGGACLSCLSISFHLREKREEEEKEEEEEKGED